MSILRGHCLCRAIRFEIEGAPSWCGHCHCESCRRSTSSPITTFVTLRRELVQISGTPAVYESSPGVKRSFCGTCGSPISFETNTRPNEIDLYAASLVHPEAVTPESHVHHAERVSWMNLDDDLPRFSASSVL